MTCSVTGNCCLPYKAALVMLTVLPGAGSRGYRSHLLTTAFLYTDVKQLGFNRRHDVLEELLSLMSRDQHPEEVRKLSWFDPDGQLSITQPLTHSLPSGVRERIRMVKAQKLVG